jgi:hypothetical protein
MEVQTKAWIENGRLQVHIDLKAQTYVRDEAGRFAETGGGGTADGSEAQTMVGGRGYSKEEVQKAVEKLDALPSAEEGYRKFDDDVDQIRTLSLGFAGVGMLYAPPKQVFAKHGVEMELDPSKVRYAQISVTREGVRRKLEGNDPQAEFYGATGLPEVVLDETGYILQNGFHRAAADVLLTGKFRATVVEKSGRRSFKKPKV